MSVDASAVVLVLPDDTVDTIITKVRAADAPVVQLLVADGTATLQALSGFALLRQALEDDNINLFVISSDEKILNAARLNQFDTVRVEGAKVATVPFSNGGAAHADASRSIPAATTPDTPATPAPAAGDRAFLDALERIPSRDPYADLPDEEAELFGALDDLSDAMSGSPPISRDRYAADRRDVAADHPETDRVPPDQAWAGPLREDATWPGRLHGGDTDVGGRVARRSGRQQDEGRTRSTAGISGRRDRITSGGRYYERAVAEPAAARRSPLFGLLVLLLVLLLLLVGIVWLLSSRVTVAISPPSASVRQTSFKDEVIPYAAGGTDQNTAAVQAAPVEASAQVTVQGQASQQLTPVGVARGTVQMINALEQPIDLPQGTEFVAKNAQGQDVHFLLDSPATVPPAVTSRSLTGISTTFGSIEVQVSARSPGSASNVPENSITHLLIPGQQPIANSETIRISHAPISGGDEQPIYVVTEGDVQKVLGTALNQLHEAGLVQLKQAAGEKGVVDPETISPSTEALGDSDSYEPPVVEPPIGQPVPEQSDPTFKVTVKARFSALATPADQPIRKQLSTVVPAYLNQRTDLKCPADQIGFDVERWQWNGQAQQLVASGTITCTPKGALSPEAISQVRNAVRGQSREAAEASLRNLQATGVIGSYQLPDKDSLPGLDFLITIQEIPPTAAPQPAPSAQPAPGAQP